MVGSGGDPSNWGRWGPDDQRGTLNLMRPETIVEASRLVRRGKVYPLAMPMEPALSSPLRDGMIHAVMVRRDPTPSQRSVAVDVVALDTHNFTHVDSLAHVACAGRLYNGVPSDAIGAQGTTRHSIEHAVIVGRALLADVAALHGGEALEAGQVIGPEDLDRALAHGRVEARPGDILLVRTGWLARYLKSPGIAREGWPGLGERTVPWLRAHDVCAVGADNVAVEVRPPERPERSLILHERFLRDLGGYLIEFLDLDQLAADQVYEGFFVLAPLRITGGVGSPVTPLLIA
jgi:kynurenine formamidase